MCMLPDDNDDLDDNVEDAFDKHGCASMMRESP